MSGTFWDKLKSSVASMLAWLPALLAGIFYLLFRREQTQLERLKEDDKESKLTSDVNLDKVNANQSQEDYEQKLTRYNELKRQFASPASERSSASSVSKDSGQ